MSVRFIDLFVDGWDEILVLSEESFLLVYSSSSLLPRDKMTPAWYMYIGSQSFRSLFPGTRALGQDRHQEVDHIH